MYLNTVFQWTLKPQTLRKWMTLKPLLKALNTQTNQKRKLILNNKYGNIKKSMRFENKGLKRRKHLSENMKQIKYLKESVQFVIELISTRLLQSITSEEKNVWVKNSILLLKMDRIMETIARICPPAQMSKQRKNRHCLTTKKNS